MNKYGSRQSSFIIISAESDWWDLKWVRSSLSLFEEKIKPKVCQIQTKVRSFLWCRMPNKWTEGFAIAEVKCFWYLGTTELTKSPKCELQSQSHRIALFKMVTMTLFLDWAKNSKWNYQFGTGNNSYLHQNLIFDLLKYPKCPQSYYVNVLPIKTQWILNYASKGKGANIM